MAAGAIPPPLFFERRRHGSLFASREWHSLTEHPENTIASITRLNGGRAQARSPATGHRRRIFENMANTTSAKKATRKIARRTIVNKSRRTEMRSSVRSVEEAIKRGDRDAALKAMAGAEPELMRAAQRNIVHKNAASRKVSRLVHQIAKLAK
jgi:small subunit ribosomal protein S20